MVGNGHDDGKIYLLDGDMVNDIFQHQEKSETKKHSCFKSTA